MISGPTLDNLVVTPTGSSRADRDAGLHPNNPLAPVGPQAPPADYVDKLLPSPWYIFAPPLTPLTFIR